MSMQLMQPWHLVLFRPSKKKKGRSKLSGFFFASLGHLILGISADLSAKLVSVTKGRPVQNAARGNEKRSVAILRGTRKSGTRATNMTTKHTPPANKRDPQGGKQTGAQAGGAGAYLLQAQHPKGAPIKAGTAEIRRTNQGGGE